MKKKFEKLTEQQKHAFIEKIVFLLKTKDTAFDVISILINSGEELNYFKKINYEEKQKT